MLVLETLLLATFSGSFFGTGKATYKNGHTYKCREISIRLDQKIDMLRLRDGGYQCGDFLNAAFDPFRFTIEEGKLIHEGQVYGKISDSELSYSVYDPEDQSTYFLTLTKTTLGLQYLEKWHDGQTIALTVSGDLKLLSSPSR
jgi:hypothetical protein